MKHGRNLFPEIIDAIQNSTRQILCPENIMLYLLGCISNSDKDYRDLSEHMQENILHSGEIKDIKMLCDIANSPQENWKLDNLSEKINENTLYSLLRTLPEFTYSKNIDISSCIQGLVFFTLFGKSDIHNLFSLYQGMPCKNLVFPEDKEAELEQLLQGNSLVLITGMPGTGKTQFTKTYIQNHINDYIDIAFLECDTLDDAISEVSFLCNSVSSSNDERTKILSEKDSDSLMVINLPFVSDNDITYIQKELLHNSSQTESSMRIVIVTRSAQAVTLPLPICNMDCYDEFVLRKIYTEILSENSLSGSCFFSDDEFDLLCKNVDMNPFLINMISKTIRTMYLPTGSTYNSHYLLWKNFKRDLLDTHEHLCINTSKIAKIHANYTLKDNKDKSSYKFQTLFLHIFDSYKTYGSSSTDFCNACTNLSLYTSVPIKKSLLERYFDPSFIQKCIERGILTICDKNCLYMPSLLVHSLWSKTIMYCHNSDSSNSFEEKLSSEILYIRFLLDRMTKADNMLSLPTKQTYAMLKIFTENLQYQIMYMRSQPLKLQRTQFFQWNSILLNIILKAFSAGYYSLAKDLRSLLYLSRTKVTKNSQDYKQDIWEGKEYHKYICDMVDLLLMQYDTPDFQNFYNTMSSIFPKALQALPKKNISPDYYLLLKTIMQLLIELQVEFWDYAFFSSKMNSLMPAINIFQKMSDIFSTDSPEYDYCISQHEILQIIINNQATPERALLNLDASINRHQNDLLFYVKFRLQKNKLSIITFQRHISLTLNDLVANYAACVDDLLDICNYCQTFPVDKHVRQKITFNCVLLKMIYTLISSVNGEISGYCQKKYDLLDQIDNYDFMKNIYK